MKAILTFLSAALLLAACSSRSNQEKAEKVISAYLDSTLDDPGSYKPVSFGKIDTVKATYFDDPQFMKHYKSLLEINREALNDVKYNYEEYEAKMSIGYYKKIEHADSVAIDSIEKSFKPGLFWIEVEHIFRAKNKMGALILDTAIFKIDSTLSRVIGTEKPRQ